MEPSKLVFAEYRGRLTGRGEDQTKVVELSITIYSPNSKIEPEIFEVETKNRRFLVFFVS